MDIASGWIKQIAGELSLQEKFVQAVAELLSEDATIPFIARYRKERTGGMDEVQLTSVRDRLKQLEELDKRRTFILETIEGQGKLTPELKAAILKADTLTDLEDLYLPYKKKRKTRATVAREKGLEPLATKLLNQSMGDPQQWADQYIDTEKGVANADEALQGARDIIAEWVTENQEARQRMRKLFNQTAIISSRVAKGKEEEGIKYKDYFEWTEKLRDAPSHRLLAMRRGEKEGFLHLDISPDETEAMTILEKIFITSRNEAAEQVTEAVKDAYRRLLKSSIETEMRLESKERADHSAIDVFSVNLKELLLAAPLGQQKVLAIDPGFRTGCKVVCLDAQGNLQHYEAIFPNPPQKQVSQAAASIRALHKKFNVTAIAIGNGTASRETETFVRGLGLEGVTIVMVNESGASIYSASEIAREEFPNHDVTVRGAVSIGRRLMDPLAELVKIDPKSIGVGQYQHDVDQGLLKQSLDDVVVNCVNGVGVELNTASKELLSYVSGLGPQLAQNIVLYREENGPFQARADLKKVPRLGAKAFEQAAGFLRIRNATNPLDSSAVHPESYPIVKNMAKDLDCSIKELMSSSQLQKKLQLNRYVNEEIGLPTLKDILQELEKPGRDPRQKFEVFSFDEHVHAIEDLRVGMKLPGIITNVTNFGAFVDVGVHQDGLVHISHLADQFVKDPNELVTVNQKVHVTVTEVDIPRKRIALSMKADPFGPAKKSSPPRRKSRKPDESMEDKLAQLRRKFK